MNEVKNHITRKVSDLVQKRIDALKIGQGMQDLPEELWHKSFRFYVKEDPTRNGGPNLRMIRLNPDEPSLTVTGFIFNKFVHPFENRFITVREAARLQGFPDKLEFKGSLTSAQRQVGNAVPVQLAEAVFRQIVSLAQKNGYLKKTLNALSLFSGAGGLDLGAESASSSDGYKIRVRVASDCWHDACETLSNYYEQKVSVIEEDITNIADPAKFWKERSKLETAPDIVFGGPPCQSFSQAGRQMGLNDERGQLIYDFIRFIKALKPSFFVMENVSNIKSVNKGAFCREIIDSFRALGYNTVNGVLCAADYGTPQKRNRMIFIGCKKAYGSPTLPQPTHGKTLEGLLPSLLLPYSTVQEAFYGLPRLEKL